MAKMDNHRRRRQTILTPKTRWASWVMLAVVGGFALAVVVAIVIGIVSSTMKG